MLRNAAFSILAAVLVLCQLAASAELPSANPKNVGISSEELSLIVPAMKELVDDAKVARSVTNMARKGKIVFFEAVAGSRR